MTPNRWEFQHLIPSEYNLSRVIVLNNLWVLNFFWEVDLKQYYELFFLSFARKKSTKLCENLTNVRNCILNNYGKREFTCQERGKSIATININLLHRLVSLLNKQETIMCTSFLQMEHESNLALFKKLWKWEACTWVRQTWVWISALTYLNFCTFWALVFFSVNWLIKTSLVDLLRGLNKKIYRYFAPSQTNNR